MDNLRLKNEHITLPSPYSLKSYSIKGTTNVMQYLRQKSIHIPFVQSRDAKFRYWVTRTNVFSLIFFSILLFVYLLLFLFCNFDSVSILKLFKKYYNIFIRGK